MEPMHRILQASSGDASYPHSRGRLRDIRGNDRRVFRPAGHAEHSSRLGRADHRGDRSDPGVPHRRHRPDGGIDHRVLGGRVRRGDAPHRKHRRRDPGGASCRARGRARERMVHRLSGTFTLHLHPGDAAPGSSQRLPAGRCVRGKHRLVDRRPSQRGVPDRSRSDLRTPQRVLHRSPGRRRRRRRSPLDARSVGAST